MRLRAATVLLVIAALLAAGAVLWSRAHRSPALPAVADYAQLPSRFHTLLATARETALAKPIDPAAVRRLAQLYQANRLDREAQVCFTWLASHGGLTAADHRLLADLALNAGDLPRAVDELRATLQADPAYLPARLLLAECLFKSGRADEAAVEYTAALAATADQPQALLGLARVALQRGDDAEAISRLERLLAVHPEYTSGAALLAQVMTRRGETERAAALTELSRGKRDPLTIDPWLDALWADCFDSQRLTLRFEELMYSGALETALPLLDRVGELDPRSWLPHLLRGWTLARASQFENAVGEYRQALQKSGDPERVLPLLVVALQQLKRGEEAEEELQQALHTRPDSVGLLVLQADLVTARGGNVQPLLIALLKKEPYLYTANMSLARILWTQGDRAGAIACLTRVAKAFPADVASRGLLAQHYLENHDPAAAIIALEQALPQAAAGSAARERLTGMLSSAFAELAGSAAQAKQFKAAADALTRLAALQADNPTVQISLGDMLYQAGETDAARTHWQHALTLTASGDMQLRDALTRRINGPITPDLFE